MSATNLDKLIALGKEQGFVTHSNISDLLPETLTDAVLEECLAVLNANDISVVDDPVDKLCTCEERETSPHEHNAIVRYAASRKWTGFTRDVELELVKRIESHAEAVVRAIVGTSLLLAELSTLGDQLRAGTIGVEDLLKGSSDVDDVCARIQVACALGRGQDNGLDANVLEARRDQMFEELSWFRFTDPVIERFENALRAERDDVLRELEVAKQLANEARSQLVEANHMQVVSSAKRHAGHGVPFAELLEAGDTGVRKALDRYEYQRGYRFSTYAQWWIHEEVVGRIARAGRAV